MEISTSLKKNENLSFKMPFDLNLFHSEDVGL
jgi:hypothetical protein